MNKKQIADPGLSRDPDAIVTEADIRSLRNLTVICHATIQRYVRTGRGDSAAYRKLMGIYSDVQDLLLLLGRVKDLNSRNEPGHLELVL